MSPVASAKLWFWLFAEWSVRLQERPAFYFGFKVHHGLALGLRRRSKQNSVVGMEGRAEQALHQWVVRYVRMRVWTSSGHSVLMLERWCNSRKHLVLTAINTGVTEAHCSSLDWWCSIWCTAVTVGSPFPLILEAVCLSPVLDLLFPVVQCFLLSWSFFFYIVAHNPLPVKQIFGTCAGMKMYLLCPHFDWKVYDCSIDFLLPFLLLKSQKPFWFLILYTVRFSSLKACGLSCSWCSETRHYLAWCGSVFTHCAGPRYAL